jgi:hypothetical protein
MPHGAANGTSSRESCAADVVAPCRWRRASVPLCAHSSPEATPSARLLRRHGRRQRGVGGQELPHRHHNATVLTCSAGMGGVSATWVGADPRANIDPGAAPGGQSLRTTGGALSGVSSRMGGWGASGGPGGPADASGGLMPIELQRCARVCVSMVSCKRAFVAALLPARIAVRRSSGACSPWLHQDVCSMPKVFTSDMKELYYACTARQSPAADACVLCPVLCPALGH